MNESTMQLLFWRPQMLESTCLEIKYRPDILRATNGAHVEMYWTIWIVLSSRANLFSASHILCFACTWNVVNKLWPQCILVYSTSPSCCVDYVESEWEDCFEWWIKREAIYCPSINTNHVQEKATKTAKQIPSGI
jgi:hypothetical protein